MNCLPNKRRKPSPVFSHSISYLCPHHDFYLNRCFPITLREEKPPEPYTIEFRYYIQDNMPHKIKRAYGCAICKATDEHLERNYMKKNSLVITGEPS